MPHLRRPRAGDVGPFLGCFRLLVRDVQPDSDEIGNAEETLAVCSKGFIDDGKESAGTPKSFSSAIERIEGIS